MHSQSFSVEQFLNVEGKKVNRKYCIELFLPLIARNAFDQIIQVIEALGWSRLSSQTFYYTR